VGFAAGDIPQLPFNLALLKGCAVMGVFWGRFSQEEPKQNQQNIMELLSMIQSGKISQHIHKIYDLESAPNALQELLDRKVIGKAIVKVGDWEEEKKQTKSKHSGNSKPVKSDPSSPISKISLGDLKNHIGQTLGISSWTTVSQEIIQKFAETTDDFQWIHVDTEKAKAIIPGGKNIAHGYLTLSLMPKLLVELLPLEGIEMALNYGVNKVRFPAPVYSGDQVRLKARLINVEETNDSGFKLFIHAEMESRSSEKPVCVAELITLVR
jgi:acyl dehydratase